MATVNPTAESIFMVDGVPLKIKLAQAERMRKIKAFALILPLLLFLLTTFVWPILSMLSRSIDNPELGLVLATDLGPAGRVGREVNAAAG